MKTESNLIESVYAKPWVPPLVEGRIKSFLYKNGKPKRYKKGEIIVSEDDYLDEIFILKSGLLSNSIIHHGLSKSYTMCGIRIPCHISGYTTYILREPAPVRITALSKSEIWAVSFSQMDEFLAANHELKDEFIRHCGRSLRSEIDAMLAMTTIPTEEKFWVLIAAVMTTMGCEIADREWIPIPVKINRDTMSCLLYVSVMTVDRLYASLVKNGNMRRTKNGYELKADAVDYGIKWIEERYLVSQQNIPLNTHYKTNKPHNISNINLA